MAAIRRSFLLRIDPPVLEALQRWANDDLRSLNGQIEFLLRRALTQAGRAPARGAAAQASERHMSTDDESPINGDV
jgi:hypothetical protein